MPTSSSGGYCCQLIRSLPQGQQQLRLVLFHTCCSGDADDVAPQCGLAMKKEEGLKKLRGLAGGVKGVWQVGRGMGIDFFFG